MNLKKMFSFLEQKEVVGVDIGSYSIKVVQLKGGPGKWGLARMAKEELPISNLSEVPPAERVQALTSSLKKIFSANKISLKKIATSVSGNAVIVRYVKFPKLSKADLNKTIQFEAEPYIPFPIQEVNIGFHILGDITEEGQKKMETCLVAAKKEIIKAKLDVIYEAGLKPAIIDVDAFALENALEVNRPGSSPETVIFLNMGAVTTNMTIIENRVSKVVRDVFIAGNSFTKALQRNFQCDYQAAEEMKKRYSILVTPAEREAALENQEALQVSAILTSVVKELVNEVQRSIDYYQAQGSERVIHRILISGGTALLKNIDKYFSQELHMPVDIFDPFAGIKGSPEGLSPEFAVALGLATRYAGDTE
ncbi:MAG: type IV pilus assembly protein PilM [Elusimicrobiota bacterium]